MAGQCSGNEPFSFEHVALQVPVNQATDELKLPPARRQHLARSVANVLKRYILIKRMEPGDRLPAERKLAESLNVSRTVIREALSQLIEENIVVRTPRSIQIAEFDVAQLAGEFAPVDPEDVDFFHLMELRAIIEIGAIETIVHRATDAHLREIEHWMLECEAKLAAGETMTWADARFHSALLHTLGNSSLDALLPMIEELRRHVLYVTPFMMTSVGSPRDHVTLSDHRAIYEAICRRDVETARLMVIKHVGQYIRGDSDYFWKNSGKPNP